MFLIWRGKWWCDFLYYILPLENFAALVKTMIPDTFFFLGGEDLHLFSPNAALLVLPCLYPSPSCDRLQRHAVQEEPDALGALLQPRAAPDDAGDGSAPNGRRAVVWENAGWQCQQVCKCTVQKGPLLCLENNAFKLNPQDTTLTKSSLNRTQRLQIGFLCTVR